MLLARAGQRSSGIPTYAEAREALEAALEGLDSGGEGQEEDGFALMLEAFLEWIAGLLDRALGALGASDSAAQGLASVVGWGLILLLAVGCLWLLWRNLARLAPGARPRARASTAAPERDRTSRGGELLALAEAQAARGEWSAALATLYEAVVHRLDERRAVRYVPAKTSNAYARELEGGRRGAWSRLVAECELVAYGERAADESRWRAAHAAARELEVTR